MIKLPAGVYAIGDPCYTIKDESWDKVLDISRFFEDDGYHEYDQDGEKRHVCAISTAYGDGTYTDQFGKEYGVDAGLIGIRPYDEVLKDSKSAYKSAYHVYEFTEPFCVEERNGVLKFGHIEIDTN